MFLAVSWRIQLLRLGRSFHQERTSNLKVSESDFVPRWDDITMHCSLAEYKLLEGTYL